MYSADYIKFIYDLKWYLSLDLKFIDYSESKYKDDLIKYHFEKIPIGVLNDVEIVFLHYHSKAEAYEKWNRRKSRIHWDNLYFKMSEQNLCTLQHLKTFDKLPYKKKFVFVTKNYSLDSQILFMDCKNQDCIPNDTNHFRKFIDLSNWLTGKPFKLKQT